MNEIRRRERPTTDGSAKLIYIFYLVGIVFGVMGIVGVVMAYVNKDDAPHWLREHYRFQIRTFWIGLLYIVVGVILSFVLIGFLILLFWVVWLILRCAKGLKALENQQVPANVTGWFF